VLTFAIASPLHWSPVATVSPPDLATNAKDNPARIRFTRSQPVRAELARFCISPALFVLLVHANLFGRLGKANNLCGAARPEK
jgi:hypothetical protein